MSHSCWWCWTRRIDDDEKRNLIHSSSFIDNFLSIQLAEGIRNSFFYLSHFTMKKKFTRIPHVSPLNENFFLNSLLSVTRQSELNFFWKHSHSLFSPWENHKLKLKLIVNPVFFLYSAITELKKRSETFFSISDVYTTSTNDTAEHMKIISKHQVGTEKNIHTMSWLRLTKNNYNPFPLSLDPVKKLKKKIQV